MFVRTPEFNAVEDEIEEQLRGLNNVLSGEDVRNFQSALETYKANMIGGGRLTTSGEMPGTAPVVKALKDSGSLRTSYPPQLASFDTFIHSNSFSKWVKWHVDGAAFLAGVDSTVCPYCGQQILDSGTVCRLVDDNFKRPTVSNLEKAESAIAVTADYLSDERAEALRGIVTSPEALSTTSKTALTASVQEADSILESLSELREFSSYAFRRSKASLSNELKKCRINEQALAYFKSTKAEDVVNALNDAVDHLVRSMSKLDGLAKAQKERLANSLRTQEGDINAFLSGAGYPYTISISVNAAGGCATVLKYKGSYEVKDAKLSLSYGERNALALVFFVYEAAQRPNALVILDDPISSFDENKRYAIINMLFGKKHQSKATLKGRTVLLLTHDYAVVYEIEKILKNSLQPTGPTGILRLDKGILTEKIAHPGDLQPAPQLYRSLAKESDSDLVKLIYARQCLELDDNKGEAWDVVSSLFHHRPIPTGADEKELDTKAIAKGTEKLEELIDIPIDYSSLVRSLDNKRTMRALYAKLSCRYEKLQVARIVLDAIEVDGVIQNWLNEAVHLDNGYVYQLDPREFELVPEYVVDRCDEVFSGALTDAAT